MSTNVNPLLPPIASPHVHSDKSIIKSHPEDKTFKSRCAAQQKELIVTFICFETVLPMRIARQFQIENTTVVNNFSTRSLSLICLMTHL
jgi:hypothetical protein